MTYQISTNYSECCLVIKIKTYSTEQMCIVIEDVEQENTMHTNRIATVSGDDCFYCNLPICGSKTLIHIFNDRVGNVGNGLDDSFIVKGISILPIEKVMHRIDYSNPYMKSFINFATRFSFNAGWLQAGEYVSDDKVFEIIYTDEIMEDDGRLSETPARIEVDSGIIEISRAKFIPMTVPNRMAILLHEFSHIFVNENMDDEVEADLNALNIYLSLGYPRIEAFEVFTQTFIDTPTDENKVRFDYIKNFIDDFDNNTINFNYE
jgi:hypothetical protein